MSGVAGSAMAISLMDGNAMAGVCLHHHEELIRHGNRIIATRGSRLKLSFNSVMSFMIMRSELNDRKVIKRQDNESS